MKQDYTRDYITECFRYYSRVKAGHISPKTEEEIADAAAAASTMEELSVRGKRYIADAIQAVYMVDPQKPLYKKTIAMRVRRFSLSGGHADTSTVYRWLQEGRRLCAQKRKLRLK